MKRSNESAFQLAFVYVGTVVGAGFATGKEIVEFFVRFGWIGLFGILISGAIFTGLEAKMMLISKRIEAESYQDMNRFLFGAAASRYINVVMFFILLGVTSVMISGAGAIFEEQLGISKEYGIFLTIILSVIVLLKGSKGLFGVNVLVVPMLIFFSLIVFLDSFVFSSSESYVLALQMGEGEWILSAISYGAFNLALSQAVLVPVANEMTSEAVIKKGAVLGGIMLTVILFVCFLSLSSLDMLEAFDIPMAQVVYQVANSIHLIYLFVIFGEVFTSVIGNLYGLERQVRAYIRMNSVLTISLILLCCYVISKIGYGTLISTVYPIFGYVSIFFILFLFLKKVPASFDK